MRSLAVGRSRLRPGMLLAVFASTLATGRPADAQFKLAGSPDGTWPIIVDDALDVYVNGVLVHSDGDLTSGARDPFPIPATVGDTVRLVVRDTYGHCAQLTPVFLFDEATGQGTFLDGGFNDGCPDPDDFPRIAYDVSKLIPDPDAPLPDYKEVQLPASAWAGVVSGPGGLLYGATYEGGFANAGILYAVPPDLSGVVVLHEFNVTNGQVPYGEVTVGAGSSTGKLFGTTCFGGDIGGGTLYSFDLATRELVTLESFDYPACPSTPPLQIGDVLYGSFRGSAGGTVYRIDTDGSDYAPLHSFTLEEGYNPGALVGGDDGYLYGVSTNGGDLTCGTGGVLGCGTAFRVAVDGSSFDVLHVFGPPFPASYPQRGVSFGSDGRLYGTTFTGVFSLAPVPGSPDFQLIHSLTSQEGGQIFAPPTLRSDGRIYVAQYDGGAEGLGRVFSVTSDGSDLQVHHEFSLTTGYTPYGILLFDAGGALYGTTEYSNGSDPPYKGTVFRLDPRSIARQFGDGFESGDTDAWSAVTPNP